MDIKKCTKCGEEKPLEEFYNSKNGKFGKRSTCKICTNKDNASRSYTEQKKAYYQENRELLLEKQKQNYSKDKKKEYVEKNKEEIYKKNSEYHKKWYADNKKNKLLKNKIYNETRESIDPEYKLRRRLRSRLTIALKKYENVTSKERNIDLLIGCSLQELKDYLALKFTKEMTWENHGKIWHIDHIKPCHLFDLSQIEQQRECFNYTNLQPLYKEENLKKHGKYTESN